MDSHPDWKPNVVGQARAGSRRASTDRSMTRDLPWGVPVPEDVAKAAGVDARGKVLYVWFDAPIGYISATREWAAQQGEPELWKDYWQDNETKLVHFIGKDNIVFPLPDLPGDAQAARRLRAARERAGQRVPEPRRPEVLDQPQLGGVGARGDRGVPRRLPALRAARRVARDARTPTSAGRRCRRASTTSSPTRSATSSTARSRSPSASSTARCRRLQNPSQLDREMLAALARDARAHGRAHRALSLPRSRQRDDGAGAPRPTSTSTTASRGRRARKIRSAARTRSTSRCRSAPDCRS